jgi:3-phenylpropionate/trans-cinnamate dioxygenase ferredoxin component
VTEPAANDVDEHELGDLSHLRDGDVETFTCGDKAVMVCRAGGALYALEDLCSHADTTLSDGLLTGFTITCPLHGAGFDVRDGKHLCPPAYTGVDAFEVVESPLGAKLSIPKKKAKPGSGYGFGTFQTR